MSSYSIWVMPGGQLKAQLQKQINKFCEKYNTVQFEPHVTLVGGFHAATQDEAISKSKQFANETKKMYLKFGDVSYGSIFTQCVYILINEDSEIMAAGKKAKQMFLEDATASTTYMPHLSLIYSDMDQEQRKVVLAEAIEDLYKDTGENLLVDGGFYADKIMLWETDATDFTTWKLIQEFELQ